MSKIIKTVADIGRSIGSDDGGLFSGRIITSTAPALLGFADYNFQNSLADTNGNMPALVQLSTGSATPFAESYTGASGYVTATVLGSSRTVYQFTFDSGLQLDVSTLPSPNNYAITILYACNEYLSYKRILQTQNFTNDEGLYFVNGTAQPDGSRLTWYDGTPHQGTTPRLSAVFYRITYVNNSSNVSLYIDGNLELSYVDTRGDTTISAANLIQFFKDNDPNGTENTSGQVARITIYKNSSDITTP